MAEGKGLIQEKKNYHHGNLKGQLLEAVRHLVETKGADEFSIAEACRLAGVSTAAPYKHFKDRHEILRGVVFLGMLRMRERMQEAADAHAAGTVARVAALGQSYIDFARAEPGLFRMMFSLTAGHQDDEELSRMGDETLGIVVGVVADHLAIPLESEEAKLRAYALWCFVHGHSFLMLDDKLHGEKMVDEGQLLLIVGEGMLPRV
ncbi:TetR/AcrR family transcriptional regulator [Aestuariibius insulae]|uniref:TetR/AcrR family transcriptional regulator n=1 Tax=Aestuariibius insulae TaxID=2058287 RepID=UPI00345EF7AB